MDVRKKIDLQTRVELIRLKKFRKHINPAKARIGEQAAGNGIGGQINTRVPRMDAHAAAIEPKFGSSSVDSSVGLSTGAALMKICFSFNRMPHEQNREYASPRQSKEKQKVQKLSSNIWHDVCYHLQILQVKFHVFMDKQT